VSVQVAPHDPRAVLPVALVTGALGVFAVAVATGTGIRVSLGLLALATLAAIARVGYIGWPRLIAVLILIILFIPIRRYWLPANLPFQLEPYRIFVALLLVGWFSSLLVDPRTRFRRTGVEGPLVLIVGAVFASIVANADRVAQVGSEVDKAVMFFVSFILLLYLISSVIRRLDDFDFLVKTLVAGGAIVAFFAIVEARFGFNVFNHLDRVLPILRPAEPEAGNFMRYGSAKLRVFGSAQHPIALSAAFVMLTPLALYLARRYRQRRWLACATLLIVACASTVSRTGIVMLLVVGLVFLWLRPKETKRMWPVVIPALIVVKIFLPGTLGAIKQSFLPAGGLIAEQKSNAEGSGSGRIADLGPSLRQWTDHPLFGQGYATFIVNPNGRGTQANILDDQWLVTLLSIGIVGFFGWLWFFARVIRRYGKEAKEDDSDRGWLLASLTAGIAAFGVGMLTYDAFAFIQVTFLLFIFVGLGAALMAERATPTAVRSGHS
jgi:O-antigen ligase